MKTIIKLLIMVAVLNAVFQAGRVALRFYQFKDTAQQAVLFGSSASTEQLHSQIMDKAAELQLPIKSEELKVHRDGLRTVAEAAYTQPVELFPRYIYPAQLSFAVEAISAVLAPVK